MIQSFSVDSLRFLLMAALLTGGLSLAATIIGGAIGLFVAINRVSRARVPRAIAAGYIVVVQGIPVLVILFLVYFGVARLGLDVPPLWAATFALSVFASGYLGDIWRGAIESIPQQQWEAADALAMTRAQQFRHVILPQAVKISLPPTVGFLVQLIKNTSIVSIVGVIELTRGGQITSTATFQPLLVFGVVGLIYFCICFPLSLLSRRMESVYD